MSGARLAAGWRSFPPRARRRLALGLAAMMMAVVTVPLLAPAGASAHLRTGTVAVDYRASVTAPMAHAYWARISQADHTLTLSASPAHVIVVLGYLGEPMVRLDRDGTWIDAASPTARAVGLLARSQLRADGWILLSHKHSVAWRDGRAQQLPSGVRRSRWAIPLIVDGQRTAVHGHLTRYPAPALLGWLLLLAGVIAFGIWLVLLRPREVTQAAALWGAAIGAVVCPLLALGFALDGAASPGTWIEGFNEIVFVAVGAALLLRGHPGIRAGAAVGLGLVSLGVALLDSPVFLHPVVLSLLGGVLTRLLVVLAAAGGLVAVGLGSLGFADVLRTGLEDVTPGADRAYS